MGPLGPTRRNKPGRPKGGPWKPSPRDLDVYARVCDGSSQRAVAKEFGISCTRVCQIGQRVDRWLTPQLMDFIREIKARHTSCLMRIYQEAMDGWRESKQDAKSEAVKDGKVVVETTTRRQGQCGNSAFLSEARAALAEIRKLWGADVPITMQHTGEFRWSGMPLDEARRKYALRRIEQYQILIDAGEN